ncbi:UNVERIFIED_CONTAM: hypothetical protein FKN15_011806 [Acipenser sinensis]
MGIPRLLSNAMARVSTVRYYQLVLVIAAALAVVAFYSLGSDRQNFSSTTKRIKETHASHNANMNDGDLSSDTNAEQRVSKGASVGEAGRTNTDSAGTAEEQRPRYLHALMMFTKVDTNQALQQKFQVAMRSMLKHARFEDMEVLTLHFHGSFLEREDSKRELRGEAVYRRFHAISHPSRKQDLWASCRDTMGIPRLLSNAMARVSTVRYYQLVLVIAAALAVVAFYSLGSDRQNFSSTTKRIKETHASHNANMNDGDLSSDTNAEQRVSKGASVGEAGRTNTDSAGTAEEQRPRYLHALMMFTKVDTNKALQQKFQVAMRSMLKHARFEDREVLTLHFVSDEPSREIGEKMLEDLLQGATFRCEVSFHNVKVLTEKLFPIVEAMQKHFSAGSGTYYSDAIFFLSVAMHRIMPAEIKRIVQLDLDLKYRTNIRELFEQFDQFPSGAVIGIAREMQPVYRKLRCVRFRILEVMQQQDISGGIVLLDSFLEDNACLKCVLFRVFDVAFSRGRCSHRLKISSSAF